MTATRLEHRHPDPLPGGESPRGWRWWLRVAEVRFRFVGLILAALLVVSQWDRVRNVWDRAWYAAVGKPSAAVSADTEYFCPMDPGVLSAWPAICPICNMDLVPRRKHDAQILPEGVVARMQLTPYRVQLAGIKTSEVAALPLSYEIRVAGRLTDPTTADEESTEMAPGLTFDAPVSPGDVPLLGEPHEAAVTTSDGDAMAPAVATLVNDQDVPRVRITLKEDGRRFVAGMSVRAVIRVPASGAQDGLAPAVPESAVVDHGDQRLVFVESMPGQFDAVPVTLGRRCGDRYPVLAGLKPGQRVAIAGAFLIDAESRLNPSLAVAYFGANQTNAPGRVPEVRVATGKKPGPPKLTAEDAALAKRQKVCPVTGLPLDSMGGPVPVVVEGRKVFLCCGGCEGKLRGDPATYLAKLPGDD